MCATVFNDIHLHRKSSDKDRCNAYGNKLLNMCKNNNICIANGRVGNDKNIGKVTSKAEYRFHSKSEIYFLSHRKLRVKVYLEPLA
jgi:hypothetical protein